MIKLEGITKSFGSLQVLKGIDLEINKGEIVSIVGPSGAGKTTLLQIMGTLDEPDAGVVQIDGTVVSRMKEKELSLNVAITRARMKLVIMGEADTLKHHGFYRKLLEFIQNIGNQ